MTNDKLHEIAALADAVIVAADAYDATSLPEASMALSAAHDALDSECGAAEVKEMAKHAAWYRYLRHEFCKAERMTEEDFDAKMENEIRNRTP